LDNFSTKIELPQNAIRAIIGTPNELPQNAIRAVTEIEDWPQNTSDSVSYIVGEISDQVELLTCVLMISKVVYLYQTMEEPRGAYVTMVTLRLVKPI